LNSCVYCARNCLCVISRLLVDIFNKAKSSTFRGQPQTGFDDAIVKRGLGTIGIAERAFALGGTAELRTGPGEGTTVEVGIPIPHCSPHP
jgi:glucose-6-phosphate-specific signal transduction histidine kinase